MADNKQLIFSVLVEAEQAIKDLAIYNREIQNIDKSIEELRKQQKAEGADVQELEQRIVRMQQARKTYQKAIAESSKELQNSIKVNTLAEGSLAGLRAELSKLNAQYDNLSRTDREGNIGKGLQENINKVTKEIKDAEFATQRFYRNVGSYIDHYKSGQFDMQLL